MIAIDNIRLMLGEPVLVAVSPGPEARWGYYQFPKLSTLPTGELLLTINTSADDDLEYGQPSPAYVSRDEGRTWARYSGEPGLTVSHSPISAVGGGEYLCTPFPRALDVRDDVMPQPVGTLSSYGEVRLYRLEECSPQVQAYLARLAALRWKPGSGWGAEEIDWDTRGLLARSFAGALSRTSFQYPLLCVEGALFYPEYVTNYLLPDGSPPKGMAVHLMASMDNGHSFQRVGLIAHDPQGQDNFSEAAIARNVRGELVCVIRRADHRQKPMAITFSGDMGRHWSPYRDLFSFGVLPQLCLLGNGVLVLAFGRPGVHLALSADGAGREWTAPYPLLAGNNGDLGASTCGYTSLVPLDESRLLIAYSDFDYRAADGSQRKAIWVREIAVRYLAQ
jgi:hypothetical protein